MNKPESDRSNRNGTADLIKGLAVVFMIQVHLMEQFGAPDAFESAVGKLSMFLGGPPCAPVFMAVLGYFLASSNKPLRHFIKRGIVLFAGGIILNIVRASNLLIRIADHQADLDPWFYIMGVDILTLAGLSVILIGLLRQVYKNCMMLYFLTAILVVSVAVFLPQGIAGNTGLLYVIGFLWGTSSWAYFPVFPWFAYVLTGYVFHLLLMKFPIVKRVDPKSHYIYFIPVWVVVILTLPWAAGISYNLNGYYHHGILFFGWLIFFSISYLVVINIFDNYYGGSVFSKWLKWMGKNVTLLYIIQWIIIGNLAPVFFGTQNVFQLIVWFVMVMLFTNLSGFLYNRLKTSISGK
jgi:uncharacterized membrane protein